MVLISILRPLARAIYVFRLTTAFARYDCALSKHALKGISRRRDLYESKRRDPRQYLRGEPRVQFHLNTTFPGQEIIVRNDR